MEIGHQMQNHKLETNRELICEDGSIWSTLIFIKIIGSGTLWYQLPPSEVLYVFQMSSTTQCKSLVMIKWHHIMKNTNKWRNRKFCIFLLIICSNECCFVNVRKIWAVEGIVPLVEGLNISNMLQLISNHWARTPDIQNHVYSMKSLNSFQNAPT